MTEKQTLKLYEKTGALLRGHFRLTSGLHSDVYLQSGGVLRVLEDERGLEGDIRVEAGGQAEVTAQERAGLLVELQRLLFGHASRLKISRAAAAGSGAAVIGRPTTT